MIIKEMSKILRIIKRTMKFLIIHKIKRLKTIIKIFWKINSLKFNREMIIFQSANSICQFWSFLQIKETTVLRTQRY